jgi:cardiolipin synthase A/B
MELFPSLLTALYVTAFLAVMVRILTVRQAHGVAMAWLLLALLVPVVGVVLYFMIGERRLGRPWIERAESGRPVFNERYRELAVGGEIDPAALGTTGEPAARLAEALVGIPVTGGHRVELLSDGDAILAALIADIDACRRWCSLEFYIWHPGGRVDELLDALARAARRGVRVRAMMDGLGSRPFARSDEVRALREAGVEVVVMLPAGWLRMVVARADLRDHRKIAVFDGQIAYTGSSNIADPRYYKRDKGVGQWVDAMIRLTGPAAAMLGASSDAMAAVQLRRPVANIALVQPHRYGSTPDGSRRVGLSDAISNDSLEPVATGWIEGVAMQPYPSGPGFAFRHVESVILTAIYSARTEVSITTPYFAPGESVITALRSAARRGVHVTVLLPLRCDSVLVQHASASHFDELLGAGVRIQRFHGGLLHTKSMVIDRSMAMFGTLNFDLRSFHLNFEVSMLVYDRTFAERLLALQQSYLADCRPLELDEWRRRPGWRRLVENAAQLASPLL